MQTQVSEYGNRELMQLRNLADAVNEFLPFNADHPGFVVVAEALLPHVYKAISELSKGIHDYVEQN